MSEDITLPSLLVKTALAEFRLRCHAASWSDKCGGSMWKSGPEQPGLVLLSATGPDTAIKAVRATLYSPDIAVEFRLEQDGTIRHLTRAAVDMKPVGYQASVAKLAPGAVHLVALAKVPGLMPDMRDDQLWTELTGPRYTTPLLRSWVGWIKRKMIEDGKIIMADAYGSTAGILTTEPEELDEIVSSGVRYGYLKLENQA